MKSRGILSITSLLATSYTSFGTAAHAVVSHDQKQALSTAHRVIGTWVRRDEHGLLLRMTFLPNGTMQHRRFNYISNSVEEVREHWRASRYGITIDDLLWNVSFSGRTMTLRSRPATADIVDRWTRSN